MACPTHRHMHSGKIDTLAIKFDTVPNCMTIVRTFLCLLLPTNISQNNAETALGEELHMRALCSLLVESTFLLQPHSNLYPYTHTHLERIQWECKRAETLACVYIACLHVYRETTFLCIPVGLTSELYNNRVFKDDTWCTLRELSLLNMSPQFIFPVGNSDDSPLLCR